MSCIGWFVLISILSKCMHMNSASVTLGFHTDKCHFGKSCFQDPKKADGEIQISVTFKLQKRIV